MRFLGLLLLVVLSGASRAQNNGAPVTFGEVEIRFRYHTKLYSDEKPSEAFAQLYVKNRWLNYLSGPLGNDPVNPLGLRVQKAVHILNSSPVFGEPNAWRVDFEIAAIGVIQNPEVREYLVTIPTDPNKIYDRSVELQKRLHEEEYRKELEKNKNAKRKPFVNRCTHPVSQGADLFWYYWSPDRKGCNLVENVDFVRVPATVSPVPRETAVGPEYARLAHNGEISVYMLFGLDKYSHGRNPLTSEDINARSYLAVRKDLIARGYKGRVWTTAEIEKIAPIVDIPPYVEEYTKTIGGLKFRVRLFFGPSKSTDPKGVSRPFQWFLKDAYENASMVMYGGHSDVGGSLYIDRLESERFLNTKIRFPANRYQIYYFHSCSSYGYYIEEYMDAKATREDPTGMANLDIFSHGRVSTFDVRSRQHLGLLHAVEDWAATGTRATFLELMTKYDNQDLFFAKGSR